MPKDDATEVGQALGPSAVETESRREAIKKIGRFTTYIAPVMLGIISQKAAAGS